MIDKNILLISLICLVSFYFVIRAIWLLKNLKAFFFIVISYGRLKNIKTKELRKFCKIGPISGLIFDLMNWDFTRYIVDKDKYFEICSFHIDLMLKALFDGKVKQETENTNKE